MEYREYQADYYQNRQNLENMSMQLLYQNALCNNLKELQAQNSGVHGNAPEYLEQYGGITPGYERTPEVKPLTNIQEQTSHYQNITQQRGQQSTTGYNLTLLVAEHMHKQGCGITTTGQGNTAHYVKGNPHTPRGFVSQISYKLKAS